MLYLDNTINNKSSAVQSFHFIADFRQNFSLLILGYGTS